MIRLIFQNNTSACITCRKILINENISIEKSLNPSDPNFVQLVHFSIKRKGWFFFLNLNIYSSTSAHLGVIFKQICSQINLGNFCSLLHFKICRFRDNTATGRPSSVAYSGWLECIQTKYRGCTAHLNCVFVNYVRQNQFGETNIQRVFFILF